MAQNDPDSSFSTTYFEQVEFEASITVDLIAAISASSE